MEISCRIYKPRRPRESPLYRLVAQHLEELLRVWPTRFVRQHGPLRPVLERVLREFLKCGLLEHGFTAVVLRVPNERPRRLLLPCPQLLSFLREEEAALVG